MQGLKRAKEIWDVLKTVHEGDEVIKITKRETIEGELGRFVLNKGEEPQTMYNRLKTMVEIEELNVSLASLRNENEKLIAKAKDLYVCNVTISNLRSENDILHAKIVELKTCKPSTSTIEHVSI